MKTTAAYPTPPAARSASSTNSSARDQKIVAAKKEFIGGVIAMSWQLTILVLVAVVGGAKLDSVLNTTPFCTVIGFGLMLVGMWFIVRRQAKDVTPTITQADIDAARKLREQEKDEDDDV